MFFKIPRCFDSHVHLLATGQNQVGLNLSYLDSPQAVSGLKIEKHHFRGDWLVGFGWDQNRWVNAEFPHRQFLDQVFPDNPVYFVRADGHAAWVNSKAIAAIGAQNFSDPTGGKFLRDAQGELTGVVIDTAMFPFSQQIPAYTESQNNHFLIEGMRVFNKAGFTHVRDMSGDEMQWKLLSQLDDRGELKLYVDQNFSVEKENEFDLALASALYAKKYSKNHLRVSGIKFYMDGALGSEGAWLTENYANRNHNGFSVWESQSAKEMIRRTWQSGLDVAIHCIGNLAARSIVDLCLELKSEGVTGALNIEHCEVMDLSTVQKLQQLSCVCHLQPCHYLSDRAWLKEKLGSLYQSAFPWAALQKHNIPIQWGSDAPIEPSSVWNNYRALMLSQEAGISSFEGSWFEPHSHRDSTWGSNCLTEFKDDQVVTVLFDGKSF